MPYNPNIDPQQREQTRIAALAQRLQQQADAARRLGDWTRADYLTAILEELDRGEVSVVEAQQALLSRQPCV